MNAENSCIGASEDVPDDQVVTGSSAALQQNVAQPKSDEEAISLGVLPTQEVTSSDSTTESSEETGTHEPIGEVTRHVRSNPLVVAHLQKAGEEMGVKQPAVLRTAMLAYIGIIMRAQS